MAATVTITVRHRLGRDEAMRRVRRRAGELQAEHPLLIRNAHAEWGEAMGLVRLTALGQAFTGHVEVTDRDVTLGIDIPLLAGALSERIETFFRRELRRVLRA